MNNYTNTTNKKELFERIDGRDFFSKTVDIFYIKKPKDDTINHFFNEKECYFN